MVKAGKYTTKKHVKSNNNEDIIVENLFNPEIDTIPLPLTPNHKMSIIKNEWAYIILRNSYFNNYFDLLLYT